MTDGELKARITALDDLARGSVEPVLAHLGSSPDAASKFSEFLAYHQLLGFAAYILSDHPLRRQFPPELLERLGTHARKLERKSERVRALFPVIVDAFEQADVPFLVLKGPHFALACYGGMDRRSFWDLDLLVRPDHFPRAHEQLLGLGYSRVSKVFVCERVSRFFTHAHDYRGHGLIEIDLHWKLASHPALRLNYEAVWASKQVLSLAGRPFYALADSYALTFLLLSIVKDIERGALRLRSMVDLCLLLRAMDERQDWPEFFAQRREERIDVLCASALALFFLLFSEYAGQFQRVQQAASAVHVSSLGDEEALALLRPERFAFRNKRWASGLYGFSRLTHAGWWAFSLPARVVIHRTRNPRMTRTARAGRFHQ